VVKGRGYIRTVNVEKSVGVFVMPVVVKFTE
jgi:hypothetical protein